MKLYEKEIWKDIIGYEGYYQVSNLGRIKSLERRVRTGRGDRLVKERILKLCNDAYGYVIVPLNKQGKLKTIKVHKLVAIAFLNHIPCGHKEVVDHINHNKKDNSVDNLRLVTQRENANLKHIKSSSKYTGVSWYKRYGKWKAYILIKGKLKHLGYFKKEYEAHLAYKAALNKL